MRYSITQKVILDGKQEIWADCGGESLESAIAAAKTHYPNMDKASLFISEDCFPSKYFDCQGKFVSSVFFEQASYSKGY